jgi:hypothetical protein
MSIHNAFPLTPTLSPEFGGEGRVTGAFLMPPVPRVVGDLKYFVVLGSHRIVKRRSRAL